MLEGIGKGAGMILNPLGDSAWLVEWEGPANERALATVMAWTAALEIDRPATVTDVVPSFASLAVYYDGTDGIDVRRWIEARLNGISPHHGPNGRVVEIPVCYDGADLAEVAHLAGLSENDVAALHAYPAYTVAALGFSPGFPYLLGLPQRLHLPRRRTPRLNVPAGSVAIGGAQAGIYPFESPGGWHLLGTTSASLFDPYAGALLRPGDRLRFKRVDSPEARAVNQRVVAAIENPVVKVIAPGAQTTVQDAGRFGHGIAGVSPNGAVDSDGLRLANLLVGNPTDAAALEICMLGPILEFLSPSTVSLAAEGGKSWNVAAGEVMDFSKLSGGVRACIGIAGGIRCENLLDSAATDLRAGFGGFEGRVLKAGDLLATRKSNRIPQPGDWHVGWRERRVDNIEPRFVRGVQGDWFSAAARQLFGESIYQVAPDSDRMGARLIGEPLEFEQRREMVSQPVANGSVQVPPDGQPIVLLAGRQTIGGYPQIGHVISVDLPLLARAWPGTKVRFREVTLEQAWELKRRDERDLAWLRVGLDFKK